MAGMANPWTASSLGDSLTHNISITGNSFDSVQVENTTYDCHFILFYGKGSEITGNSGEFDLISRMSFKLSTERFI